MKKLYYLMAALLLFTFSCEEEDDLPKPTQDGSNMMVAKINGKAWQKNSSWSVMHGDGLDASYSSQLRGLSIQGLRNADDFNNSLILVVNNVDKPGEYELREEASRSYGAMNDFKDRNNTKSYTTTAASTGKVTITKLDTQNKIISGTFSFRASLEGNPAEYVDVTEGWFDVKY